MAGMIVPVQHGSRYHQRLHVDLRRQGERPVSGPRLRNPVLARTGHARRHEKRRTLTAIIPAALSPWQLAGEVRRLAAIPRRQRAGLLTAAGPDDGPVVTRARTIDEILAAAALQELGLAGATDIIVGYVAWVAE